MVARLHVTRAVFFLALSLYFTFGFSGCRQEPFQDTARGPASSGRFHCGPNISYDVTLNARHQFRWPFGESCDRDGFKTWFDDHHRDHWLGEKIFFDDLDPKALSQVHLEHETLRFQTITFDVDDIDCLKSKCFVL